MAGSFDLTVWADAFRAQHASGQFGIITKAGREVARFNREDDCNAALHACHHYAALLEALRPFSEPHPMGDNYVKFSPALIHAARSAYTAATGSTKATPPGPGGA